VENSAASIDPFLVELREWAARQEAISGVLLVGSHARGEARDDSDVDVVLLTPAPEQYLGDRSWVERFGSAERVVEEDWGRVTSLRVWYADRMEVEFSWTDPGWAALPPDPGTRQVVVDGARILFDRDGALAALLAAVPRGG
jgi:predicted nucleotidyltransferase